jgi:hypothetical protein
VQSSGGAGGGANGSPSSSSSGSSAPANLGGGGGGGGGDVGSGGNGGKGVVIIRHSDAFAQASTTGSPAITTSSGFRIYVFNDSGTITW